MSVVGCDISEFQVPVNDTYPHPFLMLRACDGDYTDGKAPANLAWAIAARHTGRLTQFGVYVVYRPGMNAAILAALNSLGVPHDCVVMIDAETWSGQITGDHSAELDALASALLSRQYGDTDLIWGYGNRGDIGTLWSQRPSWLAFDVASYGGGQPAPPAGSNLAGWQYTDGQYSVPGLPFSSPPFGPCDHNEYFNLPGGDMPLSADDIKAIWEYQIHLTDSAGNAVSGNHSASVWLAQGATFAQHAANIQAGTVDVQQLANDLAGLLPQQLSPAIAAQVVTAFASKLGAAA